jgi:TRAP-type C4-dicarboxylate transport system permease small subunit
MAALERFDRFNQKISGWMEWIGFAGILAIILLTTLDVVGSKLFVKPLFGSLDMVMLAQLISATCTVTAALIAGRHVRVDFLLDIMPKRLRGVVDGIVYFLAFVLFAIIVWRLIIFAHNLQIDREVSGTARIPLYPFGYIAGIACIPVCLVYLSRLIKLFVRSPQK